MPPIWALFSKYQSGRSVLAVTVVTLAVNFFFKFLSPYIPDVFQDTGDGRGFGWGLCHFSDAAPPGKKHGFLARFDCSLGADFYDPKIKNTIVTHQPAVHFAQGLDEEQIKERRAGNIKK